MPIFRRETDAPESEAHPVGGGVGGPPETVVASGSRFDGEISGATAVRIEGRLVGKIRVEGTVTVAPRGRVEGEIHARTVRIGGRVEGGVRGSDRVELTSSGGLEGDIASPRVVIAEGAFFKGEVEMSPRDRIEPPRQAGEEPA